LSSTGRSMPPPAQPSEGFAASSWRSRIASVGPAFGDVQKRCGYGYVSVRVVRDVEPLSEAQRLAPDGRPTLTQNVRPAVPACMTTAARCRARGSRALFPSRVRERGALDELTGVPFTPLRFVLAKSRGDTCRRCEAACWTSPSG
jgi:hypothetical protein